MQYARMNYKLTIGVYITINDNTGELIPGKTTLKSIQVINIHIIFVTIVTHPTVFTVIPSNILAIPSSLNFVSRRLISWSNVAVSVDISPNNLSNFVKSGCSLWNLNCKGSNPLSFNSLTICPSWC